MEQQNNIFADEKNREHNKELQFLLSFIVETQNGLDLGFEEYLDFSLAEGNIDFSTLKKFDALILDLFTNGFYLTPKKNSK